MLMMTKLYFMQLNKTILCTCIFLFTCLGFSQSLKLSDKIQDNLIVSYSGQPLVLIDFWATWCGPCVPATEQLEINQQGLQDEVYMISVSDEPLDKIKSFAKRMKMKLAIYQDVGGENVFEKFKVHSRPYAVLLNLDGDVLWKGHPSGLTAKKVKRYAHKQGGANKTFNDLVVVNENRLVEEKIPNKPSIKVCESTGENSFVKTENYVSYQGDLVNLLAILYAVSPQQIIVKNTIKRVEFKTPILEWKNNKISLAELIQEKLSLKLTESSKLFNFVELSIADQNLLWERNQLDWGQGSQNYLVGNSQIKADNLTIAAVARILSEQKNTLYAYLGDNHNEYDWDFHYVYDNLMKESLSGSFGIQLSPKSETLPIYIIQ